MILLNIVDSGILQIEYIHFSISLLSCDFLVFLQLMFSAKICQMLKRVSVTLKVAQADVRSKYGIGYTNDSISNCLIRLSSSSSLHLLMILPIAKINCFGHAVCIRGKLLTGDFYIYR